MKRTVRLSENNLKGIISETVRQVLKESILDKEDNYPRLGCEKSRPCDVPPGDDDVHYPCDVNPDVWNELQGTIDECVRKVVYENTKKQRIKQIVAEELTRKINETQEQATDNKRNAVMKALKDPKYDHAQIAYRLWPDMDKDTARSLFSKMANGTPDNDGVVRQFNDEDVNSIYQMIRKR